MQKSITQKSILKNNIYLYGLNSNIMNPFSYGTIVTADHFYDRKEECAKLVDTLSGGNNMILYAPRRFGKTSLVFRVIEQLEKRQSSSRKQLLNALTIEGTNVFSSTYIKKHRLPAAATLQRAVKELINDGIIGKSNNQYYIADPFFKCFVAQY